MPQTPAGPGFSEKIFSQAMPDGKSRPHRSQNRSMKRKRRIVVVGTFGNVPYAGMAWMHCQSGEGLFAFQTIDHIVAAIDAINSDYERHSRAAGAIAVQYFKA